MLQILQRMYDINPNNPTTITDGISITCSDVSAPLPIGGSFLRHAFIVLQDADITVKNAGGATLQRGTDYFLLPSAMDLRYSKDYNTSIYSGIKFKAAGTYTVTSFISCGTYPRAEWFNYLMEQFSILRDTTVATLSNAVTSLSTTVTGMLDTVTAHSQTIATHTSDTDIHITASERAKWNGKSKIYVVADITARDALTGLTAGDCAYVVNDGDGKRAEYMWTGSAFMKISDPDWENLSLAWANLTGIPANVTALINAAGLTNLATALTVAQRDSSGKMRVATPVAGDDGLTVTNKEWVASQIASSGGGNLSTSDTTSTDGEIVVTDGTTGKVHKKSGTLLSTLLGYFTSGAANIAVKLLHTGYTLGDVKTIIANYLTANGAGHYMLAFQSTCTSVPSELTSGWVICDIYALSSTYAKIIGRRQGNKLSWGIDYTNSSWDASWTQLTDASGNAVNANSLGGVAAASYALKTDIKPFMAETVVQSGSMSANNNPITATDDGVVQITITLSQAGYVSFYLGSTCLDTRYALSTGSVTYSFKVKSGQTFKVYSLYYQAASYSICSLQS